MKLNITKFQYRACLFVFHMKKRRNHILLIKHPGICDPLPKKKKRLRKERNRGKGCGVKGDGTKVIWKMLLRRGCRDRSHCRKASINKLKLRANQT